jgi:chromosome segregation ATPase
MQLTKESIKAVRLTGRLFKSYDAREVDILLEEIAAAADAQCAELGRLRGVEAEYSQIKIQVREIAAMVDTQRMEIGRLRNVEAEYAQTKNQISEALLVAQRTAAALIERTKKECVAELAGLQHRKDSLQQEVASLERYKARELEKLRHALAKMLNETEQMEGELPCSANKVQAGNPAGSAYMTDSVLKAVGEL